MLEAGRVAALSLEGLGKSLVLDVGTGTGVFAEEFALAGSSVIGIDPDGGMLATAVGLVGGARFVRGSAEDLPFRERCFDLTFLGLVLHETDSPLRALVEVRRVTRTRAAVLEWPFVTEGSGPPLGDRLDPEAIRGMAGRAGFGSCRSVGLSHLSLFLLEP